MDEPGTVSETVPFTLDADVAANPQAVYGTVRDLPGLLTVADHVVLSRRADIDEALRHPEVFSSDGMATVGNTRPMIPLEIDPPEHRKFRKLLDPIFAPKRMATYEASFVSLVDQLIDSFIDAGEVDFAQAFSVPFPSTVFLTMFGLPLDEVDRFLAMKDGIIRPHTVTGSEWESEPALAHQAATVQSIYAYFDGILDERQADPQDDLLTFLLDAEVDGDRLSRTDVIDICFLLLVAGLDTVSATLDCVFIYLARHPEQRRLLIDDPTLIPAAVEELLRWETPVMGVARIAAVDTELGGCPIARGTRVLAILGSANTDTGHTPDAEEIRFDREANRHLAFGGGIHRCLGSHLARLELRVAVREWHRRIPDYHIAEGTDLVYSGLVRSVEHLPLVFPAGGGGR